MWFCVIRVYTTVPCLRTDGGFILLPCSDVQVADLYTCVPGGLRQNRETSRENHCRVFCLFATPVLVCRSAVEDGGILVVADMLYGIPVACPGCIPGVDRVRVLPFG